MRLRARNESPCGKRGAPMNAIPVRIKRITSYAGTGENSRLFWPAFSFTVFADIVLLVSVLCS